MGTLNRQLIEPQFSLVGIDSELRIPFRNHGEATL